MNVAIAWNHQVRMVRRQGRRALGFPELSECRTAVDEGAHQILEISIAFAPRVTRAQQTNGPLREDVPVEIQPSPILIHEEPPDVIAGEWSAAAVEAIEPIGNLIERLDVPARSDDERRSGERIEHLADVAIEGGLAVMVLRQRLSQRSRFVQDGVERAGLPSEVTYAERLRAARGPRHLHLAIGARRVGTGVTRGSARTRLHAGLAWRWLER